MECNVTFGVRCESAETHSCNATIAKGLQVWNNSILADHNLSNAMGNRNMLGNLFHGLIQNKDIISDVIGIFSPKAAQIVRPTLVLMEKVAHGEKLEPDGNKPETESHEDNTDTDNGKQDSK